MGYDWPAKLEEFIDWNCDAENVVPRDFFLGRDWELYLRMRSRLMPLSERLKLMKPLNASFVGAD
jgi:hypothetical protein